MFISSHTADDVRLKLWYERWPYQRKDHSFVNCKSTFVTSEVSQSKHLIKSSLIQAHDENREILTCSSARDTQVWISSSSLDLWYFLVVFTAIKMSLSFNWSEGLDRELDPPRDSELFKSLSLWGLGSRLMSLVLISFLWVSLSPDSEAVPPAPTGSGSSAWCTWFTGAGLAWGRGWGRSSRWAGGWKAGMSRRSSEQNPRKNTKQDLLKPTEAIFILTGQRWRFSASRAADPHSSSTALSPHHPITQNPEEEDHCLLNTSWRTFWRQSFFMSVRTWITLSC